ncbi:MAG: hypothetical protein VXZ47_04070 [Candidatus Thermoplasmatota archaeon]|nr:hypothetical protein [Candidatus Thermoplasmatota archaeon]
MPDTQGAHGVSRRKITVNIPAPKNVNTLIRKIVRRLEHTATIDDVITVLENLQQLIMCCFSQR